MWDTRTLKSGKNAVFYFPGDLQARGLYMVQAPAVPALGEHLRPEPINRLAGRARDSRSLLRDRWQSTDTAVMTPQSKVILFQSLSEPRQFTGSDLVMELVVPALA